MVDELYPIAGVVVALIRKDSPSYQVYRDFLSITADDEWAEIVNLAGRNGLGPKQVRQLVEVQVEMAKRLRKA